MSSRVHAVARTFPAMNRARTTAGAVILAVLMLAGCSQSEGNGAQVAGKWGSTDTGQPNLTINSDGSYSGSDGCNTMTGKGTISGMTIELGTAAMTQKACEGVDTWLSGATKGTADGDVMTMYDKSGKKIGTLDRDD